MSNRGICIHFLQKMRAPRRRGEISPVELQDLRFSEYRTLKNPNMKFFFIISYNYIQFYLELGVCKSFRIQYQRDLN